MSICSDFVAAVETTGYPCAQNEYLGTDETYFVFSVQYIPDDYADDDPLYTRCRFTMNLFAPRYFNTTDLAKSVKLALRNAGFTYATQTDASTSDGQNIVFECEKEEAIDYGNEY